MLSMRVSAIIERSLSNFCQDVLHCIQKAVHPTFLFKRLQGITIQKFLAAEYLVCSRIGIAKFIKVFKRMGSMCRQPGSGRLLKVTHEVMSTSKLSVGLKLEMNILPQQIFAKSKEELILKGV